MIFDKKKREDEIEVDDENEVAVIKEMKCEGRYESQR